MTTYSETVADVLDQRIADLAHDVRFYRDQPHPRHWRDLRIAADVELRSLRNLRRRAVRLAEARPDPLTESKKYAEWTQGELVAVFGR